MYNQQSEFLPYQQFGILLLKTTKKQSKKNDKSLSNKIIKLPQKILKIK